MTSNCSHVRVISCLQAYRSVVPATITLASSFSASTRISVGWSCYFTTAVAGTCNFFIDDASLPPVWTWNPGSSAPWNPHPKSPCVGEERKAWSGSNPIDWIPNRGVQGEPAQKILRSTYILAGPTPCTRMPCQRLRLRCPHCACVPFHCHRFLLRRLALHCAALYGATIRALSELVVPSKPPVSRRVRGWWSPRNHRTKNFGSLRACRRGRDRWSARKLDPCGR